MTLFKKIRWKNFLMTGNYWLEIDLSNSPNTLIIGKNGSGKSTLLDAICFALFGVPFRKINKPTLVNSINGKNCLVELEFSIDGIEYKIIRGLNPIVFKIYKNGTLQDQETSNPDYQDYFEKFILKWNFKSFTQIVVLGSAIFTPFMQLKAADRRSVIEDLLDISVFSTMNTLVKKRISTNKETINLLKIEIDSAIQRKELQERHISELKQNKEELILEYRNDIEKTNAEIVKITSSINENTGIILELKNKLMPKEKISTDIHKLQNLFTQITQNQQKGEKSVSFFESNDTCPTCSQQIDETFKFSKIEKLNDKKQQYVSAIKELEIKLTEKHNELNELNELDKKLKRLEKTETSLQSQLISLNKNVNIWNKKISEIENRSTECGKEYEHLQLIIDEINTKKTEFDKLNSDKLYYESIAELLKDSGIKSKIIKQYLPIINSLVNKHLTDLDFFVNFHLDEQFKESIKSRHRDEFSYYSFSQGQKLRIDMALMLTWRSIAKLKNAVNTNLLILDEIFDSSLDASGADELMKILTNLDGNVFVISHRGDILQDKFVKTIKFVKQHEFSQIEHHKEIFYE